MTVTTRASCRKKLELTSAGTIKDSDVTDTADCVQCKLNVSTGAPALQCDSCDGWIHCICAKVSGDLYSCLQTTQSKVIRVACLNCLPQCRDPTLIMVDELTKMDQTVTLPTEIPYTTTPLVPRKKVRGKRRITPVTRPGRIGAPKPTEEPVAQAAPKLTEEQVAQTATVKLLSLMDNKYQTLLNSLADECSTTGKALHGLQTSLSELRQDLASLRVEIATSLPGPIAAKEAVRLSAGQIKEAADELTEKALREKRLILWGQFQPSLQPTEKARQILSPFVTQLQREGILATWLQGKLDQRIHGLLVELPSTLPPGALLDMESAILPTDADLRGISLDRPVRSRKTRQTHNEEPNTLDDQLIGKKPVVLLEKLESFPCESSLDESYASISSTLPVTSTPTKSHSSLGSLEPSKTNGSTSQFAPPSSEGKADHGRCTVPTIQKVQIIENENKGLLGAPPTQDTIDFFHQRHKRRKPPEHKLQALKNPWQIQQAPRTAQRNWLHTPQGIVQATNHVNPLLLILLSLSGMRWH